MLEPGPAPAQWGFFLDDAAPGFVVIEVRTLTGTGVYYLEGAEAEAVFTMGLELARAAKAGIVLAREVPRGD